jgi:hypothetical protein
VNKDTVKVDTRVRPQKLGTTCSAEGAEAHYTLLPPGNSFYLARWGKVATAGTSESMVVANDMSGIQFWEAKTSEAQFAGILPPSGKHF